MDQNLWSLVVLTHTYIVSEDHSIQPDGLSAKEGPWKSLELILTTWFVVAN